MIHNKRSVSEDSNKNQLVVSNFQSGETVSYSLVLLKGTVSGSNINKCFSVCVKVSNLTFPQISRTEWPVHDSRFRCVADLRPGWNVLMIQCGGTSLNITLNYKSRKTNLRVTPVYFICDNHDGQFQAPVGCDNSVESACRRLALGCRLIQCLFAEKLYEQGHGRKTFQLEHDHNSLEDCVVFKSTLSVEEARSMEEEELWTYFGREVMSSELASKSRKYLGFISCTWWDGSNRKLLGHAALGGGGLALFGTAALHTWPQYLNNIPQCFLDTTAIDTSQLMDDSCFRGTYGASLSTTLGSVCHELGHTFDLGHSTSGIMGRGFDHVRLVFVAQPHFPLFKRCDSTVVFEKQLVVEWFGGEGNRRVGDRCGENKEEGRPVRGRDTRDDDLTQWAECSAALLASHRWFNDEQDTKGEDASVTFDHKRNVVGSKEGLRVVELRGNAGLVLSAWSFKQAPTQFLVPAKCVVSAQLLVAQDTAGNIIKQELFSG